MNALDWIPQSKSNNISMENTTRIKPTLLTILELRYISTKEDNFKRMMLYFRILEPNSLTVVNEDMNDKRNTETNYVM